MMGWHVSAWCSPSIWSSRLNCRQCLTTTCQVSLHLSICTWAIQVLNTYWELRDPTKKLHQIKIKCTTDFTGISLIFTPGSGLQRPSGENKNHYKEYYKARPVHIHIKSKDITIPKNSQTENIHEPKVGTRRKAEIEPEEICQYDDCVSSIWYPKKSKMSKLIYLPCEIW